MSSGKAKPPKRKPAPPASTALAAVEEPTGMQWLRALSATEYACDQNNVSIEELHKRPRFNGVALSTFFRWSVEDRWTERRREFIERWQKAIERRIGDQLVQTRIKEMERMQKLYDAAMTFLEENMQRANSWEGVAAIMLRMADVIDEFREKISSAIIPQAAENTGSGSVITVGGSVPAIRPKLSEEEARAAAKLIIEKRREQIRADIALRDKEAADKKAAQQLPKAKAE